MKELGEYLKQTRVSSGVSVTEACEDLDFSTSQLENIESGNVKAFKDIYELKNYIKAYSKYLGLDSDKVVDEFNGFLFQHTSRISLDDIVLAQKKKEEEEKEKRVKSPYTMEYKEKKKIWPWFYVILVVLIVLGILYLIITHVNRSPSRTDELRAREEVVYEFA